MPSPSVSDRSVRNALELRKPVENARLVTTTAQLVAGIRAFVMVRKAVRWVRTIKRLETKTLFDRQRYPIGRVAVFVTVTLKVTVEPVATIWLSGCKTIRGSSKMSNSAGWLTATPAVLLTMTV